MTPDEIIQTAYKMATGDDENVAKSDPVYDKYLTFLNILQSDWSNETLNSPQERWYTLETKQEDNVNSGEDQEYIVNGEFAESPLNSYELRIKKSGGVSVKPRLVSLEEFAQSGDSEEVYAVSGDRSRFYLKKGFAEKMSGGTIEYTTYNVPVEPITKGQADGIVVDNPNWLIYMLAAEIARSDIVQAGQYGNLLALADNMMTSMKNRQRGLRIANMRPWGNRQ